MKKNKVEIINIRVTLEEKYKLERYAKRVGLTQSSLIRSLIEGYEPREKPDEKFYETLNNLSRIGNNLNQIAIRLHMSGYIDKYDKDYYDQKIGELTGSILEIKKHFLLPEKINRYIKISKK